MSLLKTRSAQDNPCAMPVVGVLRKTGTSTVNEKTHDVLV